MLGRLHHTAVWYHVRLKSHAGERVGHTAGYMGGPTWDLAVLRRLDQKGKKDGSG